MNGLLHALGRLRWQPKIYTAADMAEADARRDHLLASLMHWRGLAEERQEAIDRALDALRAGQYVGGPPEKKAWDLVWDLLGPFHTQHQGQGETPPSAPQEPAA